MQHTTSSNQRLKFATAVILLCCLLCSCSGVWNLGTIPTKDGSEFMFVHAKSRTLLGFGGTLTGLYVFKYDPKTQTTDLVRADANGSTNSALENLGHFTPGVP